MSREEHSRNMSRKRSRTSTSIDDIFDNEPLNGVGAGHNDDLVDTGKLSKSCDLCKLKKVKCDGAKPLCSFCIKNDMESCHYSIMKKPGLKPGYGKGMNQRLDGLEVELRELRNEVLSLRKVAFGTQESDNGRSNISSSESSSDSNSRSVQIPSLLNPVSSLPNGTFNFGLPSSSHCLLLMDLFFKNVNPMFPLLHPGTTVMDLGKAVHNTSKGVKPPLLLYAIVLVTLKYLNNDQMTEEQKGKIYEHCKEYIITTALRKINIESLQCMILLAYESLSGKVKVPESWNYVSIAADYANYLKLGKENSNKLSIVTGDSPSSVNSSMHSSDPSGRRKSKSLNNRSINLLNKPENWIDEESRRHCFWCIYILDKLYAISSSHDLKLKPSKITCFLPVKLVYWMNTKPKELQQFKILSSDLTTPNDINAGHNQQEVDSSYDSFTFYIELNKIMGDIHTFSIDEFNIYDVKEVEQWKRKFANLDNQMNTWRRSLPFGYQKFLKNGKFPNPQQKIHPFDILLFVFYYTTFVKLHSPAGYPHGDSNLFKPSEDSRAQCLEAADEVYTFVSQLPTLTNDDDIFEKLGPHFGFYIWINCRILFVDVIHQAQTKGDFTDHQRKLSFFANVLRRIGKFWDSSMLYFKILEFLHVSDLSYVKNMSVSPAASLNKRNSTSISETGGDDGESSDEQEITDEHREPTKVVTDMRLGSHSLVYWFNKLVGKSSKPNQSPMNQFTGNNITNIPSAGNYNYNNQYVNSNTFSNFQTPSIQGFEEFQVSHDDFFNFLALDINGSGSFQDINL